MAHNCHGFVLDDEVILAHQETTEEVCLIQIALEEEKLKGDSEKDVRRQLEQQHIAASEEKAVEGVKTVTEKRLSDKGEAVEAKLAPALSAVEHITEGAINDSATVVEDLQDELQVLGRRIGSHHRQGRQGQTQVAWCFTLCNVGLIHCELQESKGFEK
ncbi:hypothetical protein EDC04DRAFT_2600001 [Pisolithus marmoratus]|nr:hypothetical protein EDC04DRAFT_2600001 [Pisolithus marmoratus]